MVYKFSNRCTFIAQKNGRHMTTALFFTWIFNASCSFHSRSCYYQSMTEFSKWWEQNIPILCPFYPLRCRRRHLRKKAPPFCNRIPDAIIAYRCKIVWNCTDYLMDLSNLLILIGTFGPLLQWAKLALSPVKHAFALRIQKKTIYLKYESKYIVFTISHLLMDFFILN